MCCGDGGRLFQHLLALTPLPCTFTDVQNITFYNIVADRGFEFVVP